MPRVLDHIPGAAYACDVDGRITAFNAKAVSMWGRRPAADDPERPYCGSLRLYHLDGSPMRHDACWMARAIKENRPFHDEPVVIEQPSGARVSARANADPIHDEHGRVVGGLNIIHEMTDAGRTDDERRRIQSQLVQSQKLESLGTLAAGVAHDFNNLLTVILGHSSLAREELGPDSPATPLLEQVEVAARHASDLSSQLLAFAGKEDVRGGEVALDRLVTGMRRLIESAVTRRVRTEFAIKPAMAWGDSARIRQVVMNLIANAAEAFDGAPGRIWVGTDTVDAAVDPIASWFLPAPIDRGVYGMVEVRDSGPGMAPDVVERIFDPFFTTRFVGRGLGLAAVQGIVKAHRGALHLTTAPGEGTTFRVYFPSVGG